MRITQDHIEDLYSAEVVAQDGDSVGKVGQVYLDDQTGAPAWVTVKTGFFGTKETFVPLQSADYEAGTLRVPYEKSYIKDAPSVDADSHMSEAEQDELYRYYNVQGSDGSEGLGQTYDNDLDVGTTAGVGATGGAMGGAGYGDDGTNLGPDTGGYQQTGAGYGDDGTNLGPDTTTGGYERTGADLGDEGRMTLHEERVDVGTERVQTGRVRLRKHVVTEQETVTVPVQREEFEIVREPVGAGETTGSSLGEDEIEVPVHEERVVVDKDVVATEQVGVDRRVVTEDRAVTADVAREEVDVVQDETSTGRLDGDTGRSI